MPVRNTPIHSSNAAVLDDPAAPLGDEAAEPGLEDHQDHGHQDQHGHHVVEHRARQREQEHAAGDAAESDAEPRIMVRWR